MEYLDLYDINRTKTGEIIARGTKMPKDRYRLVVRVIIFNSEGKMLIQQRAADRNSYPNMWDFSVGGSVEAGETSSQGAERELLEELGLKYAISGTLPSFSINFEQGFDDFYIINLDINAEDVVLQKEEVQAVKWADKNEIISMIRKGEFICFRESLVDLVFSFNEKRYGTFAKD